MNVHVMGDLQTQLIEEANNINANSPSITQPCVQPSVAQLADPQPEESETKEEAQHPSKPLYEMIADIYGNVALVSATVEGRLEDINKLLDERPLIDTNIRFGPLMETPLLCAIREGFEDVAAALIHYPTVNVNATNSLRDTPLAYAVKFTRENTLRLLLLRNDIDPHRHNSQGETPLILAARAGHERMVLHLIMKHTALDKTAGTPHSNYGRMIANAAECAAQHGHGNVVKCLIGHYAFFLHLHYNHREVNSDTYDETSETYIAWLLFHDAIIANAIANDHVGTSNEIIELHQTYRRVLDTNAKVDGSMYCTDVALALMKRCRLAPLPFLAEWAMFHAASRQSKQNA